MRGTIAPARTPGKRVTRRNRAAARSTYLTTVEPVTRPGPVAARRVVQYDAAGVDEGGGNNGHKSDTSAIGRVAASSVSKQVTGVAVETSSRALSSADRATAF